MQKARVQKIHGTDYVYCETSFRVPGKAYPGHTRTYIGKMTDGSFVPNAKFLTLLESDKESTGLNYVPAPKTEEESPACRPVGRPKATDTGSRLFCGEHLVISTVCKDLHIEDDLHAVFGPERARKMLSLATYLVSEPDTTMYRFDRWALLRMHTCETALPSPRSSELFGSITEDEIQRFQKARNSRTMGCRKWLAVDSTSISSFFESLALVAAGKNKDHDVLEQVNLLLVFDQDADVPVFYRLLRGCIPDVSTVTHTLDELHGLGMHNVGMVLDRGFYSERNVISMLKKNYRFTIGTNTSVGYVQAAIAKARPGIMSPSSYDEEQDVFFASIPVFFAIPVRGRKPDSASAWLHIYYSKEREADDIRSFMKHLMKLKDELEHGTGDSKNTGTQLYFTVLKDTDGKIVSVVENTQAINEKMERCGFFAILTNETLSSPEVLSIYRTKDRVEKAFNNLKDRLSMRRTGCSSDVNFRGKVFVQFLALMITSHIQKEMKRTGLYSRFTFRDLLDEVMPIEFFEYAGRRGHYGEITEKQGAILRTFNVNLPLEAWPTSIRKEIMKEKIS